MIAAMIRPAALQSVIGAWVGVGVLGAILCPDGRGCLADHCSA